MGTTSATAAATGKREIYYPESDGKPMAETDLHRDEMLDLIARLRRHYGERDDVYVSGNLLVYYEEGNSRASVAPDVFVVFGVPKGRRRIYRLWQEGVAPAVVIEVTSRKTKREDLREKMETYARLGVAEYFLYDPEAEYLPAPLQGHRLLADHYLPITPDADGSLRSAGLGLDLRLVAERLELFDTRSGKRLPRLEEQVSAEAQRAELEQERAELEHERAELERERADLERVRADREHERAELERERAEQAEAELALLRDELRRLQDGDLSTSNP
jgi:Uma2 family endonuclease